MSTQKVPLDALQKIRQYIHNALALPDSENYPRQPSTKDEELPKPNSIASLGDLFHFGGTPGETIHIPNTEGQWFISATNPGSVVTKLPGLQLKPEIRLVSYLYRLGENGINVTWAVPEALSTTAHLEEALRMCGGQDNPPTPEGALRDFMGAIEGDRSPLSYVIASILRRELLELGALGKTSLWATHQLIDTPPQQPHWQWRIDSIKNLSPKVRLLPDGKAVLEFFTQRKSSPTAIFQHLDQYAPRTYQAQCLDRVIAIVATPSKV
jgi:hypothetical protein